MPALPTVLARSAGGIVAVPNVQVTTGAIAGGLASAAESTGRLANAFEQQKEKDARLSTSLKDAQLQIKLSKLAMERESSGDPLDNYASWLETTTGAAYDELIAGAANDYERTYLTMAKSDGIGRAVNRGLDVQEKYVVGKRASDLDTLFGDLQIAATLDPSSSPTHAATFRDALNAVDLPFEVRDKFKDAERKINAAGVAAMIEQNPYAGAGMVDDYLKRGMLDADSALTLMNRADAGIKSREAEARAAAAANTVAKQLASINTRFAMKDAIATVRETGKLPEGIDAQTVAANVGADDAVTFQNDVAQALDYHAATTGFEALPNQDIVARVDGLKATLPQPGEPGYAMAVETLDQAEKKAEKVKSARDQDPAGSVEMLPAVREARAKLDPSKPETVQALVSERMKAQAAFMPSGGERPLTKVEIRELTAPLRAIPPTDIEFQTKMDEVLSRVRSTYGEYAKPVLQQIATAGGLDDQTSEAFSDEIYNLNPTRKTGRMIDLSSDAARAGYALNMSRTVSDAWERATGTPIYPRPSQAAIMKLKAEAANPAVIADFDAKFGPGSAAEALKK